MHAQTFITWSTHRRQGNFLKKYNFLEFCIYIVVSLSGMEAGWAVVVVLLDSTMFNAQRTPKLLLPSLHIGGRGIFKKSTISWNFAFTLWLVFQEWKQAGRLLWYGWIAQCLTHNARPNFYYLVYT